MSKVESRGASKSAAGSGELAGGGVKWVVVTGATGGLGSAVVPALREAGFGVVAVERSDREVADTETLVHRSCDVTDADSVSALFAELPEGGDLWGLVNIVGGYRGGVPVGREESAAFDKMLSLNLRSSFLCSKAFVGANSGGAGRIVNVSSVAADRAPAGHFAYAASKAGVLSLTQSMAQDYRRSGLRVNAVQPGMIATKANLDAMPDADHDEWVEPEEVAAVVAFLMSPAASGVNGAAIRVVGGG